MIDPSSVAGSLAPALPATGPDSAPVAALRPPAPDAATRFAELMAAGPAPAAPAAVVQPAAVQPASLGDRVLQGLQQVQGDFQGHLQAVGRLLEPGAPAPGVTELLRLQLGMAQLAVQVEVVGKAIGRSTQNIDQLVRMQ